MLKNNLRYLVDGSPAQTLIKSHQIGSKVRLSFIGPSKSAEAHAPL
jgi:hypothetical protein